MLAGILLKLGGYGLLRFVVPVFPGAGVYFYPVLLVIGSISILYSSLAALRQVDLKKIIAYSSVAHMNLGLLGVFTANAQGVMGSLVLAIGHGLVSSALFFLVGVLYDRHHSRTLRYFGGLTQVMPLFSTSFLYFSLANMGLPGTSNFVGEVLIIVGLFRLSALAATVGAVGTVLCAGYSLWLHNRLNTGTLKFNHVPGCIFVDLTVLEVGIFFLFFILSLLLGLYPLPVLRVLAGPCAVVL
jgi:NADH:ubiquinone oxidoreductase subunit 4 (subunit M)